MQTVLRKMGNSTGIILPKALLGSLGMATGQALSLRVEDGQIIATPVLAAKRADWAHAAQQIAERHDEETQVWQDFGNEGDATLTW
jgi:antitoxin MazE